MEENREIEIDLKKIFRMLKQKAIYIVSTAVICAIIAGCFTNFFITPQYTATVKLHAWSNSDNFLNDRSSISRSDYEASEMLVNTYLVVVTSTTYLEKVADEAGGGITAEKLSKMLSCSQIEDTTAFKISITSTDKVRAAEIANIVADTCPEEIVRVLKVGGVEVIDYAKEPTKPSSPSLKKNVLIGFMAGFALSFLLFFIKDLFDTSIKNEEDLVREFTIPIIGTVPKLMPAERSRGTQDGLNVEPPKPAIIFNDNKEEK